MVFVSETLILWWRRRSLVCITRFLGPRRGSRSWWWFTEGTQYPRQRCIPDGFVHCPSGHWRSAPRRLRGFPRSPSHVSDGISRPTPVLCQPSRRSRTKHTRFSTNMSSSMSESRQTNNRTQTACDCSANARLAFEPEPILQTITKVERMS